MTLRFAAWIGVAAIAVAAGASILVAGQAQNDGSKPATGTKAWTAPKTPDGQPDLQGTWLNYETTPFEAPEAGAAGTAENPSAAARAAEFDANQPVTLKGTVTKVESTNPHIWIFLDVQEGNGTVVNWAVEGGGPNALYRRGFTKNSLPSGTEVVTDGYRAKDGSNKINGRSMVFADGKTQFLGSSGTGAPSDGKDPSETKQK